MGSNGKLKIRIFMLAGKYWEINEASARLLP